MRSTGLAAAICAAFAFATPAVHGAGPQTQAGFAVDRFDPSARGSDWFVLDSLDFRDDGRGALGVVGEYAYKPLVVNNADGSERAQIVSHQLYVHPGGSLIVLDRLRLSVDIPVAVYDQGGTAALGSYRFNGPSKPALGDSAFAADVRIFGRYGEVVTGAVGLEVVAPTGSRNQYTGDGKTRLVPRIEFAGVTGQLAWAVRVGLLFRTEDPAIAGQARGESVVFGGAVGWRPQRGKLVVGPEVYGSTSFTDSAAANTPVEALLGAHYAFAREWRVGLGVGPGFTAGLGTPVLRTALSLELVSGAEEDKAKIKHRRAEGPSDRDHDAIPDTLDACPDQAGPANIDASLNGCPPPPDSDGDGIADNVDACPDEKGTPNADPELNGCPPDADEDGIPDALDACPLRAGVEQADKAQNGCPPDSDRDGIIDADDACPDVPGAVSKDPQDNGCPLDPDRDHDGIPNESDACPSEAGPKDTDPQKNGCPRAILRGAEIRILDQVRFEPNSARIVQGGGQHASTSADVLGAVAKVMIDHPEIQMIEVQGHTDNRGDSKANKRLSEQRAQAVVKWLVGRGLAPSRFTAVGYGDERPIDTNGTDSGRTANRRVEFHVTTAAPVARPGPKAAPSEEKKP